MQNGDAVEDVVSPDDMEMQDADDATLAPPSFAVAPPNFVSTSDTERNYGKMSDEDVFCSVLQRLGVASNSQISKLMMEIRPVSRTAAETVARVLRQSDWLASMSAEAESFHRRMPEMLTVPPSGQGLTRRELNTVRRNRLNFFAEGMAEYRTMAFVQQEGFEMLLKHVSTWPLAPTTTTQQQKDRILFSFRKSEKKMLEIINRNMRWHRKNLTLQRMGCLLLERFVMRMMVGNGRANNTLIAPNAVLQLVIPTILLALESFPHDEDLAQVACCALAASCYSSHFERVSTDIDSYNIHRRLFSGSDTQIVIVRKMLELMRTFRNNAVVVEAAVNVAYFFVLPANPGLDQAVETVFCAMNSHIDNEQIQMYGCLCMQAFQGQEVIDNAIATKYIYFLVNCIQMNENKYVMRAAALACSAMLRQRDEALVVQCQDLCGEAGLIRLILCRLYELCPTLFAIVTGDREKHKHVTLVWNAIFVCVTLLSQIAHKHAKNNKRLLDADAPRTLMYVQTAFCDHNYTGFNPIWENTLTTEYFVWTIFAGLSVQPTDALREVALQLFCTEFTCESHKNNRINGAPNTVAPSEEVRYTPVHFCCRTLARSTNIKALTATLDFLLLCAHTPGVRATMDDELTNAMVIAISRCDGFAATQPLCRHYVRKASIQILEYISRTKMLRTEAGLMTMIFKPVSPALALDQRYTEHLRDLRARSVKMHQHYLSRNACLALVHARCMNAQDKNAVLLLQKEIGVQIGPSTETVIIVIIDVCCLNFGCAGAYWIS